jgi:DNA-binding MarR family transcriptional regulator
VLHRLQRSSFLRPRERLYELLTLHQADSREGLALESGQEAMLDQRTIAGYVADLEDRSLLERTTDGSNPRFRLTATGRRRLHLLIVDLARELEGLSDAARELLRRSFVPLALEGVRRVAFYPFGETAEVAFTAMEGLGFDLVAIVDDAENKQGLRFHGMRVESPDMLKERAPEVVIVTTAAFQDLIVAKLRAMQLDRVRIHTL